MTKNDKIRNSKIADLGCALCRHQGTPGTPAELHHIRRTSKEASRLLFRCVPLTIEEQVPVFTEWGENL